MTPAELRGAILRDLLAYGRERGTVFQIDHPHPKESMSTQPIRFYEGIAVEVDITPEWFGFDIEGVAAATAAMLAIDATADRVWGASAGFSVGVKRIVVHLTWPAWLTVDEVAAWRLRMIERIEEQPGMAERKARWTEWQNEKYGTPEEREARRLRTLEKIRAQAVDEFVASVLA